MVPKKQGHWMVGEGVGDSDGLALQVPRGEGAKVGTKDMAEK